MRAHANRNYIQKEIKSTSKSGNACYHLVQNLLSSSSLSKNIKIMIHRTIILPVVLYGCETWSLTLREDHRLRVFENRVLRRIFGPKREEMTELRKLHNEELSDLYCSPNIVWVIISRRKRRVGHAVRMGGRGEVYTGFWWGNLRERDHLGDLDINVRIRWICRKWDVGVLTGSIWLRIGTGGGQL